MGEVDNEVKMAEGGAVMPQSPAPVQQAPAPMIEAQPMGGAPAELPKDPMQDMQRVAAAPASTMTATDIIRQDMQGRGYSEEKEDLVEDMMGTVAMNKALLLRENDTVFVGIADVPGEITLHTFTADTPDALADSVIKVMTAFKRAGIKSVKGVAQEPAIVSVLEQNGFAPQTQDTEDGIEYSIQLQEMV